MFSVALIFSQVLYRQYRFWSEWFAEAVSAFCENNICKNTYHPTERLNFGASKLSEMCKLIVNIIWIVIVKQLESNVSLPVGVDRCDLGIGVLIGGSLGINGFFLGPPFFGSVRISVF